MLDKLDQTPPPTAEPTPCVLELPARPIGLAVLVLPAGGGEVMEPAHERLVASEPEDLFERARGLCVLRALDVTLGSPHRRPYARACRRPLDILVHAS
jgi:hypothetical protein